MESDRLHFPDLGLALLKVSADGPLDRHLARPKGVIFEGDGIETHAVDLIEKHRCNDVVRPKAISQDIG
jgi:hypothetical protein